MENMNNAYDNVFGDPRFLIQNTHSPGLEEAAVRIPPLTVQQNEEQFFNKLAQMKQINEKSKSQFHSPSKTRIIDIFTREEKHQDSLLMLQYKLHPCQDKSHQMNPDQYMNECINYHSGLEKRRPLFTPDGDLAYSPTLCQKLSISPEPYLSGTCTEQCPYSHNMFESQYHYYSFRTKICSNLQHLQLYQQLDPAGRIPASIAFCSCFHAKVESRTVRNQIEGFQTLTNNVRPFQPGSLQGYSANFENKNYSDTQRKVSYTPQSFQPPMDPAYLYQQQTHNPNYVQSPQMYQPMNIQPYQINMITPEGLTYYSQPNNLGVGGRGYMATNYMLPQQIMQDQSHIYHMQRSFTDQVYRQTTNTLPAANRLSEQLDNQMNLNHNQSAGKGKLSLKSSSFYGGFKHQSQMQTQFNGNSQGQDVNGQISRTISDSSQIFSANPAQNPQYQQNQKAEPVIPQKKKNERTQNQRSISGQINLTQKNSHKGSSFKGGKQGNIFEVVGTFTTSRGQEVIKHLCLDKFKVDPCNLHYQHNHKHCRFYHTNKDKRRHNGKCEADLCPGGETDICNLKEDCPQAHNRVERLYHIEKYKTKFCTHHPNTINKCDYGEYCSFAHSLNDIKTRIIHKMYKDADFYMFYFKTEWCPFNDEHNKAQCDYAHNWQDFRRKPDLFNYNSEVLCENWQAGTFISKYQEGCMFQAACDHSHGWKEQEYHPRNYKTKPCEDKKCNSNGQCPFYHSQKEMRVVEQSNLEMVMTPKVREAPEQLNKINVNNLVINNVNHLKELLLNLELTHLGFFQLSLAFKSYKIPLTIIQYIDEKGVVSSERMNKLKESLVVPQKRFSENLGYSQKNEDKGHHKQKSKGGNQNELLIHSTPKRTTTNDCSLYLKTNKSDLLAEPINRQNSGAKPKRNYKNTGLDKVYEEDNQIKGSNQANSVQKSQKSTTESQGNAAKVANTGAYDLFLTQPLPYSNSKKHSTKQCLDEVQNQFNEHSSSEESEERDHSSSEDGLQEEFQKKSLLCRLNIGIDDEEEEKQVVRKQ